MQTKDRHGLPSKLSSADQWVRDNFAWLSGLAQDLGCEPQDEAGPGRAFRSGGTLVLRVHPKRHHLGLGFSKALGPDVQALTAGLRSQRGHAWVNYAPETFDQSTLELLLDLAVAHALPPSIAPSAAAIEADATAEAPSADLQPEPGPPLVPAPPLGRPGARTRDDDADLALVLSLLRAFALHERTTGRSSSIRVLREAVYFHWEGPRLPAGRKYAPSLLHSQAARDRRDAGQVSGLVYEHAIPISLVLRELLADVPEDVTALRSRLDATAQRVIITKEEDERLDGAGLRSRMPDRADVWSRYRHVGIDHEDFRAWEPT